MNANRYNDSLVRLLKYSVFLTLILVPFYAFFTTWIGSNTGGLHVLRAWKEFLLVISGFGAAILLLKDSHLRDVILKDRMTQVIGLFSVWVSLVAVLLVDDLDSTLLGLTIQLRPLIFFIIAAVVSLYVRPSEKMLIKLVAYPAVGVVAFGLLQVFALPHDFLKHFGYQKGVTIPPFFTIDEQFDQIRIFSTLRGPNPLGVYLIAPLLLILSKFRGVFTKYKRKDLLGLTFCFLLILPVLYGSHSRSAWLGAVTATALYAWLAVSRKWKLVIIGIAVVGALIGGVGIYQNRQTGFVQDVVLHDNPEEGGEISSNRGHLEALKEGVRDVKASPVWGCGPGCAGPASVHSSGGGRISENFFLQTAQEVGLVGLLLLTIIYALVVKKLLLLRSDFSRIWLAVFLGVSVASMLSHAWADDTVAYIWWGIAGLLLGFGEPSTQKSRTKPRIKVT